MFRPSLLLALLLAPALAFASSHSEAPGTARDRTADDTDMYAFVSADAPVESTGGTVLVCAVMTRSFPGGRAAAPRGSLWPFET